MSNSSAKSRYDFVNYFSTTSIMTDHKGVRLTTLSPEIRLIIYQHLFLDDVVKVDRKLVKNCPTPAIARTCRLLRKESSAVYLRYVRIDLSDYMHVHFRNLECTIPWINRNAQIFGHLKVYLGTLSYVGLDYEQLQWTADSKRQSMFCGVKDVIVKVEIGDCGCSNSKVDWGKYSGRAADGKVMLQLMKTARSVGIELSFSVIIYEECYMDTTKFDLSLTQDGLSDLRFTGWTDGISGETIYHTLDHLMIDLGVDLKSEKIRKQMAELGVTGIRSEWYSSDDDYPYT